VANEMVGYRVTGRVAGGDTYTDYQDGWRGVISPAITWKPDEATEPSSPTSPISTRTTVAAASCPITAP